MTISPKMKKILAVTGGVTLLGVCMIAMTKCSSNGNARDEAQANYSEAAARADSLQTALNDMIQDRDSWYQYARARGDTIRELRNEAACADSIVILKDSIGVLNDSINTLNSQLTDCRNRRATTTRRRSAAQTTRRAPANVKPGRDCTVAGKDGQVTNNNNNSVVVVPAQGATNVTINGGNGNTVNVNNGTINNYYAPAQEDKGTVKISSSASVTTTYVVKVQRAKCK